MVARHVAQPRGAERDVPHVGDLQALRRAPLRHRQEQAGLEAVERRADGLAGDGAPEHLDAQSGAVRAAVVGFFVFVFVELVGLGPVESLEHDAHDFVPVVTVLPGFMPAFCVKCAAMTVTWGLGQEHEMAVAYFADGQWTRIPSVALNEIAEPATKK